MFFITILFCVNAHIYKIFGDIFSINYLKVLNEAEEVFVCKMLAKSYIKVNEVDPSIIELYKSMPNVYKSLRPHGIYMGEIIGHYVRKN